MLLKIIIAIVFLSEAVFAAASFHTLRHDKNVPEHCRDVELEDFDTEHGNVIYGIDGAIDQGFSHEIRLQRQEARDLWDALNKNDAYSLTRINSSTRVSKYLDILRKAGREGGFDYGSEGEVLEALALIDLQSEYPNNEYYHTGGVEYSDSDHGRVIGELDVLVGRRSDCKIVVVGEAKLGLRRLGKARQQLARFENFLSYHFR